MKKNPFANVVDIALLRSLCEDFTRLTGLATALLDMEGNVLVACGWQEVCTSFHRVAGGTALKCLESDTILADRLARGENYYIYRCGNGLTDVAVPIVIDGTQVARLYSGQFLSAPPDMEFFRKQAAEYGFDQASYLDAVNRVPIVSEERVRQAMDFLCRLAEIIVRMGVTNRKVDDANIIVKNSQAVLFRWRSWPGRPIEYVSDNVTQFGYAAEELISNEVSYFTMLHPEDLHRITSLVDEYYRREVERFDLEYRIVTKAGDLRWVEDHTVPQRDARGKITHYQGIVIDVTERKRAERAQREHEERLRLAMTAANQGFYDLDLRTGTAKISPEYATMLGYEPQEYDSSLDFWTRQIHPDDRDRTLAVLSAVSQGEMESYSVEYRLRCKSGEWKWILSRGKTTDYLDDGAPARLMGIHIDISERRRAEETLRESEGKFRTLAETSPTPIILIQGEKIVYANEAVTQFTGYGQEELLHMRFWEFVHDDFRELVRERGMARERGEPVPKRYDHKIVTKGGEERWAVVSGSAISYQGKPARIITLLDFTEAMRAQERMQAALAEKMILLQEVHHRVKNNLQIITSLLDLQADYIHDENSLRNIRDCQSRIRSMAIVHEQLYKSDDFSHIDFSGYVNSLVSYLCLSYGIDQARIRIEVDVNISLDMVRAIPCGLIVNELVANALKYAYPEREEGTITVSGYCPGDGMATLEISDNGVGLPAGLDFRNTETMGLQIVNLLVRQMRGSVAYRGDGGASFIITFPVDPAGTGGGRSAPPASGGDRQ